MQARDLAGKRGEFIASERLLDFCGRRIPYFDPCPLGEKFPTYDLLVELTGQHASKPYFLAQVKSTRSGGKKGMAKLKVQLKARNVRFMVRCPIPTYLIGVDEKAEVAYIVSIHANLTGGITSIPTKFPLDRGNLRILRDEVLASGRPWPSIQKRKRRHSLSEARPMAQKTSQQQRFIAERVRALAVVYLTRRDDVIVTEETADVGVDLWVTLHQENKDGHRKFGVELKGVWTEVTADRANKVLYPSMQRMLRYGPFPFPVVLFFFTMENNEGWYTWAAEPVVSSGGDFEIVQHGEASCRPIDTEAIDKIVEAVDRWYDAFFAKAIRETPAGKRK